MISPAHNQHIWETIELALLAPPTQRSQHAFISRQRSDAIGRNIIHGADGATGPPCPGATSR